MVSRGEASLEVGRAGSSWRAASGGSFYDHHHIRVWFVIAAGTSNGRGNQRECGASIGRRCERVNVFIGTTPEVASDFKLKGTKPRRWPSFTMVKLTFSFKRRL